MADIPMTHAVQPLRRVHRARALHGVLAIALCIIAVWSLTVGATSVTLEPLVGAVLRGEPLTQMERVVLFDIRLPRMLLGVLVGAALAVSGALMQGLFRNPLADPGLLGVSAGATLGAVTAIVITPPLLTQIFGRAIIPFMAFFCAWVTMLVLYGIATRRGRTSVATMLLGGIAISALIGALVGLMVYYADDLQLRELTFWSMGSLTGASWTKLVWAGPVILFAVIVANIFAHGLNGLALGEATAAHIGHNVQRVKRSVILLTAAATGVAVAVSGGIGFVGIVVPHLLRLATGPDHRTLLINSGLLGAILLLAADMVSRVVIAPSELPIGIVTAVFGAPVFLWILLRNRNAVDV